ncbi:MAG: efflux RND transporter periplasmic adaptor subunit [Nitrospirae bacterium]|nr:efflux RND transporter periplasmic adaptor subunit [Nitrospirota bacterium]
MSCSKGTSPKNEAIEDKKVELHTAKVVFQKVPSYIEGSGSIQPDLEGGAKILSPLQGSVENIFVKIGDCVRKEMSLAVIKSSDMTDIYAGYLSSLTQIKQTERLYNLNKELFDVGAVTKNDLLGSEANLEQAKAISEGLKRKLDIYGTYTKNTSADRLTLKAPIDGCVADITAHIGDRFDTATALMTLANPHKVLVVANIYDTDIRKIHKGREVVFAVDTFPDTQFKGIVSYVSDVEDMDSRTIKVYIKILKGMDYFKQNMFLKINIFDGERLLPIVPKSAIIYKDEKFYVNVKSGEKVVLTEVKAVKDVSNKLMAVEGLKDGDEIVSSAIDMEKQ